jgi:phosphoribosylaminoimidazole-succinocarboxamide synthase
MWRAYKDGEREFCGITLPEGLKKDQKLPEILITPSTKGILKGWMACRKRTTSTSPAATSSATIRPSASAPGGHRPLRGAAQEGFNVISEALAALDQVFVDTKFEFGYVTDAAGREKLIYMDEVGTPTAPASGTAQPFAAARSSRSQRASASGC